MNAKVGFQIMVASLAVAGCATDDEESSIGVYDTTVVESRVTERGVETSIYDMSGETLLAEYVRAPDGATHVRETQPRVYASGEVLPATDRTLDTGIAFVDLDSYNADVNRTWERAVQIRQGTVGYGYCGPNSGTVKGWILEHLIPDGWWGSCCQAHDNCYAVGGDENARSSCDIGMAHCMAGKHVPDEIVGAYYGAVRAFGSNYFNYTYVDPWALCGGNVRCVCANAPHAAGGVCELVNGCDNLYMAALMCGGNIECMSMMGYGGGEGGDPFAALWHLWAAAQQCQAAGLWGW